MDNDIRDDKGGQQLRVIDGRPPPSDNQPLVLIPSFSRLYLSKDLEGEQQLFVSSLLPPLLFILFLAIFTL